MKILITSAGTKEIIKQPKQIESDIYNIINEHIFNTVNKWFTGYMMIAPSPRQMQLEYEKHGFTLNLPDAIFKHPEIVSKEKIIKYASDLFIKEMKSFFKF